MTEAKHQLSPGERLTLIKTLNALPGPQFDELIFALNPPPGNIPSNSAPQGDRSAYLLQWVESPIGPGLADLKAVLSSFLSSTGTATSQQAPQQQTVEALLDIIKALSQNQAPKYDLRGAQFAGGFAETVQGNQIGGTVQNFHGPVGNVAGANYGSMTAHINQNSNDITYLLTALREAAQQFPEEQKDEALMELDDLESDLKAPKKQEPKRIGKRLQRLIAMGTAAKTLASGAATFSGDINEFIGNVMELAEKVGLSQDAVQLQKEITD
ncbi:hypothetical protein H6F75_27440 [Nodosilinea sp. FACHB-131]|uniref:hypothetical protein n=1 Tax=Cyanophyceae TaxID=3028117 RepID=UPI0016820928|nr:hypothetical protein [Nodosilinea sp. FACHB-131]MBD1877221.1 hypothetical protein [Nodosilinea sp. FACHB-131]